LRRGWRLRYETFKRGCGILQELPEFRIKVGKKRKLKLRKHVVYVVGEEKTVLWNKITGDKIYLEREN